jgi:hypothetical protein
MFRPDRARQQLITCSRIIRRQQDDGKFHRIEVKVNRPGLTVRSRKGYALPKGKQAPKQAKTGGMAPDSLRGDETAPAVERVDDAIFAAPFKDRSPMPLWSLASR